MRKFIATFALILTCAGAPAWAAAETSEEYAGAEAAYRAGNYSAAYLKLLPLAQENDPSAQFLLGRMSDNGFGSVQLNTSEAFRWYQKAAAQGNGPGLFAVAKAYASGRGVAADPRQAIAFLTKAAKADYVPAIMTLAGLFQDGRGMEKNAVRAAEWERRAAEHGYLEAEYRMGERSLAGDGVPASPKAALDWFKRAADQGHPGALFRMAQLNATGAATQDDDKVQTFVWLTLASQRGNDEVKRDARQQMAAIQSDLSPEELASAQEQVRAWKPSATVAHFVAPGDEDRAEEPAQAKAGGKPAAAPAKAAAAKKTR